MNKRTQIGLILVITLVLLLGLTVPGTAKKAPDFRVDYEFTDIQWDNFEAKGAYELYWIATPDIVRTGVVTMDWTPKPGMKQGHMYFSDDFGTFEIWFTMPVEQANAGQTCGTGTYITYIDEGTGLYDGVGSSGTITMCRQGDHTIYGTLEGIVGNSP